VEKKAVFQSGSTTIELNKVIAFVELPEAADASPEDTALTVHMADGTSKTIRGDCDAEAFAQALDEHLEAG
jgi:hypothetical protein